MRRAAGGVPRGAMDEIQARYEQIRGSRAFWNIVRAYALDKKSVLDIGCCYGEHLVHFGPGSVGLSINKEEADYGAAKGIAIRLGNVETDELETEAGQFDV